MKTLTLGKTNLIRYWVRRAIAECVSERRPFTTLQLTRRSA